MEQQESWMHKIRDLAPDIEDKEYQVYKCEAEVKKTTSTIEVASIGRRHQDNIRTGNLRRGFRRVI
jgi:hypothetical protein